MLCFFFQTKSDKRIGFSHLDELSPGQVALRVVKLLPAVCDHLEGTSGFFQVGYEWLHPGVVICTMSLRLIGRRHGFIYR